MDRLDTIFYKRLEMIREDLNSYINTYFKTSYRKRTMNVYAHINFDDLEDELRRMEEFRKAQA